MKRNRQARTVARQMSISGSAPDSPFVADATPFFDRCETGIMSLHHGGRMGLLDLFNWRITDTFLREVKFITYVRPEMGESGATAGHLSDPCATPNGFEFGTVTLSLEDFGRYGRSGPVRDVYKPERYCETDPRYDLDGTLVTSETEWDMLFAMDALKQDLFRHVITGNAAVAGQFDGLQQWINTGYDSAMLDSYVIDWAGNDMDGNGGGAITVNGDATPGSFDLVDMLLALYRRYKQRVKWSPQLDTQARRPGDFVLVMPQFLTECLLNKYTCWSVCEGKQYNEANLQTFEARSFRDGLMGGLFGAGEITLDGDRIPLYVYDWETMHGSNRGDIYFLTRTVGNVRIWEGEHLDAARAATTVRDKGHANYRAFEGDGEGMRLLVADKIDNLCDQIRMWWRGRLWCRAPYLQARIMNVECETILDPLSPDPLATSFYPVTSFTPATTG
ncbi:MAG: hypothetical protein QM346_18765 [Chloroflexota bacterium]|nr:hypothetical protein [Chloroflexota bacterium]